MPAYRFNLLESQFSSLVKWILGKSTVQFLILNLRCIRRASSFEGQSDSILKINALWICIVEIHTELSAEALARNPHFFLKKIKLNGVNILCAQTRLEAKCLGMMSLVAVARILFPQNAASS